jgi:hypothetical protein
VVEVDGKLEYDWEVFVDKNFYGRFAVYMKVRNLHGRIAIGMKK